jgi:signal transduction histidine kinase
MRLSGFILGNIEPIVQEWENFARSLGNAGKPLNDEALRDHAESMLRAIAADLATAQSPRQQMDKSHGHGPAGQGTAAESHASTRLMSGFTLDQVVSEFRALRASVIKLWMRELSAGAAFQVEDMIRFNEAIDQALAESIGSYAAAVQASRNIFLGILGHDLRSPLSAILLGADVLLRTDDLGARPTKIASRVYSNVKRASEIVGDLLDFTRSQVGPGIPVRKVEMDIVPVCERIVEECRTVHADADVALKTATAAVGDFDGARLEQVFSNLINNAVQHGDANSPISVTLECTGDAVLFSVHNSGTPIPDEVLPSIFNPMDRYSPQASMDHGPYASLGLGLFIAAEIVAAHEGHIEVTSNAEVGTTFVVRLPLK